MQTKNIMIVGVGGQGTLLLSRIIGAALGNEGLDVKVSEVHGMSQRGGSVVTYVKLSSAGAVGSPVICEGEADAIVSFECLEAARWLPYLKRGGMVVDSSQRIDPMPVITGVAAYPDGIGEGLRAAGADVHIIDAQQLAAQAGSDKAANVVLLGALCGLMERAGHGELFNVPSFEAAIEATVPPKTRELNARAFEAGHATV